jgi:hypothetical protein
MAHTRNASESTAFSTPLHLALPPLLPLLLLLPGHQEPLCIGVHLQQVQGHAHL